MRAKNGDYAIIFFSRKNAERTVGDNSGTYCIAGNEYYRCIYSVVSCVDDFSIKCIVSLIFASFFSQKGEKKRHEIHWPVNTQTTPYFGKSFYMQFSSPLLCCFAVRCCTLFKTPNACGSYHIIAILFKFIAFVATILFFTICLSMCLERKMLSKIRCKVRN